MQMRAIFLFEIIAARALDLDRLKRKTQRLCTCVVAVRKYTVRYAEFIQHRRLSSTITLARERGRKMSRKNGSRRRNEVRGCDDFEINERRIRFNYVN